MDWVTEFMKNSKEKYNTDYELAALILMSQLITGKWKIPILWYLGQGPKGFNELHRLFIHTSSSIFTRQIQDLQKEGLIKREICNEAPFRVRYSLTEIGEKLIMVFYSMIEWSDEYIKTQKEEGVSNIDFIQHSFITDKYKAYEGFSIRPKNKQLK
jgi:DNA-binding HxlR family transcriptional regulator